MWRSSIRQKLALKWHWNSGIVGRRESGKLPFKFEEASVVWASEISNKSHLATIFTTLAAWPPQDVQKSLASPKTLALVTRGYLRSKFQLICHLPKRTRGVWWRRAKEPCILGPSLPQGLEMAVGGCGECQNRASGSQRQFPALLWCVS